MSSKTLLLILIAVLVLIPLATAAILPHVPALRPAPDVYSGGKTFPDSPLPFDTQPLGDSPAGLPIIANLQIVDFDGDGANDIIACDVSRSRITLLTRDEAGAWNERTLVDDVAAPAHATVVDLDGDGDLDIVTSEFNARPMVLVSNLTDKTRVRYVEVKLTGTASNRDGLGAIVKVTAGGTTYTKVFDGNSGYLSHSLYPLYFGLGAAEAVERIEVIWPSGKQQVVSGPLKVNSRIDVREQ
jgi:hypothetical protein